MKENQTDESQFDRSDMYVIQVKGLLPERWQVWFEGMQIQAFEGDQGQKFTTISGPVQDQAALFGILERIRDLGLPLVEVRINGEVQPETSREHNPDGLINEE